MGGSVSRHRKLAKSIVDSGNRTWEDVLTAACEGKADLRIVFSGAPVDLASPVTEAQRAAVQAWMSSDGPAGASRKRAFPVDIVAHPEPAGKRARDDDVSGGGSGGTTRATSAPATVQIDDSYASLFKYFEDDDLESVSIVLPVHIQRAVTDNPDALRLILSGTIFDQWVASPDGDIEASGPARKTLQAVLRSPSVTPDHIAIALQALPGDVSVEALEAAAATAVRLQRSADVVKPLVDTIVRASSVKRLRGLFVLAVLEARADVVGLVEDAGFRVDLEDDAVLHAFAHCAENGYGGDFCDRGTIVVPGSHADPWRDWTTSGDRRSRTKEFRAIAGGVANVLVTMVVEELDARGGEKGFGEHKSGVDDYGPISKIGPGAARLVLKLTTLGDPDARRAAIIEAVGPYDVPRQGTSTPAPVLPAGARLCLHALSSRCTPEDLEALQAVLIKDVAPNMLPAMLTDVPVVSGDQWHRVILPRALGLDAKSPAVVARTVYRVARIACQGTQPRCHVASCLDVLARASDAKSVMEAFLGGAMRGLRAHIRRTAPSASASECLGLLVAPFMRTGAAPRPGVVDMILSIVLSRRITSVDDVRDWTRSVDLDDPLSNLGVLLVPQLASATAPRALFIQSLRKAWNDW